MLPAAAQQDGQRPEHHAVQFLGPACQTEHQWWQIRLGSGERLLHIAEAIEVQVRVSAIALHGDDLQVPAKVARVEAGDGQAIAVAGQHRRPVCALPAVVHLRQR